MSKFLYIAKKSDGTSQTGTLDAPSEPDVRNILVKRGLLPVKISQISQPDRFNILKWQRGVPLVQKLFFTQNLEVMIRSGFSLGLALQTLILQMSNKKMRAVVEAVTADVQSGISFTDALRKHPRVFSEIFISMIAAGEASGKLEEVLKRLATQLKKDHQLIAKVRNALTYPIIVVVAMIGIGIAMFILVIPKLIEIFQESRVELPLPTRLLIATSNFMAHQWYVVLVSTIVAIFILNRLWRNEKSRRWIDILMLRLPIVGPIIKKIHLARFTRTLSSLLSTDIHIVECFQIISKTLSSRPYRETISRAAEQLKTGVNISKVLASQPRLFPPLLLQMTTVGEQSGTLDQITGEVANFYEADVDDTMSNLSTIIEPVLMLILGVVVALLAVSVILPIYSLTEAI